MTVPSNNNREDYSGNDVTTVFSYSFPIFEDSDLQVLHTDSGGTVTTLVLDTDYTVSGAGDVNGGSITYPISGSPLATGESLAILRVLPVTQETDLRNQGSFFAETHEDVFDRIVMILQQHDEALDRAFSLIPADASGANVNFPSPVAEGIFAWDSAGTAVEYLTGASVTHPYLAACLAAQAAAETAETNAQTSETNAATSESNAATEVTYAAEWANKAEDSLVSAAAGGDQVDDYSALHWANKASATYDQFDDRYLGDKASDPTLDNDGNALLTGALYFNTTANEVRVYNGSAWNPATASIDGVLERFTYTATASQTAFTGPDDNGNSVAFDNGLEQVFLNGVAQQLTTDYTRSGGNTITLTTGATAGDILEVFAWGNLSVATNIAVTDAGQTFTAGQRGQVTTLTDGATITPNFDDSNNFSVTLGGNRTLANPTNVTAGQAGSIFITQDGTGSRTLSYGSQWKFEGGDVPVLTTTASAVDRLDYICKSATEVHAVLSADIS